MNGLPVLDVGLISSRPGFCYSFHVCACCICVRSSRSSPTFGAGTNTLLGSRHANRASQYICAMAETLDRWGVPGAATMRWLLWANGLQFKFPYTRNTLTRTLCLSLSLSLSLSLALSLSLSLLWSPGHSA
eukprot:Opistho-2@48492